MHLRLGVVAGWKELGLRDSPTRRFADRVVIHGCGYRQTKKLFSNPTASLSAPPVWQPDGRGLLVLDRDGESHFTRNQIASISLPEGKFRRITRDINDYADLSLAADGRSLVTVLNESQWNLFLLPASGVGEPQQITSGKPIGNFSWTPAGQLLLAEDLVITQLDPDSGARTVIFSETALCRISTPGMCAGKISRIHAFWPRRKIKNSSSLAATPAAEV